MLWKQNDYWTTPLETLGRGLGDCEDYAIAKYISLRALGVIDDKLRLIYEKQKLRALTKRSTYGVRLLCYTKR
ncbi:transglutaminase-like cysteine peptidase [Pseudoalteromonas sp. BSi20652]|uniref:transglutaminase-like cysteine peptidase n=1 Tax=Pseudoalteromonas sp. BSi20652 TaxID=388384 RepID=UPI001ED93E0C|nr:transglutaminase-like cysteine peptidase [Pseudoalteromonas sp. BSi20652]